MNSIKQIKEMAYDLRAVHSEFVVGEDVYTDYDGTARGLVEKGYRKQSEGEWISVEERLPTEEEEERGLVGIVNGYNGRIRFTDAIIFVNYDFGEKEWWSQDYDIIGCKVEHWMPLPEAPKMKGGAE